MTALSRSARTSHRRKRRMRAVICREPGRLERVSGRCPWPTAGLVPVDIKAIGICGTDFHIFEGSHPFLEYPRVMGHELSGIVAEGSRSGGLAPGTPVVDQPLSRLRHLHRLPQGQAELLHDACRCSASISTAACASGSWLPEENLYPGRGTSASVMRPWSSSWRSAPTPCAARGSRRGDRVLVVGAGPIGVGTGDLRPPRRRPSHPHGRIAEARLAYVATGSDSPRPILAGDGTPRPRSSGATGGDLFDVVFDATGNARAMEALLRLRRAWRHAGLGRRPQGGHHLLRRRVPQARDDRARATRNATRKDFETVMAPCARRPCADGRAQHPQRHARRTARGDAGLARTRASRRSRRS